MPELPEVETIVNDLKKKILGIKIADIEVLLPRIIQSENFRQALLGNRFKDIRRIGKMIVITLEKGGYLLIHLKMTGQLIYLTPSPSPRPDFANTTSGEQERGEINKVIVGGHSDGREVPTKMPGKWTRVIFTFKDKSKLYFNDLRTFGYLKIVDQAGLDKAAAAYGLEPFSKDFKLENFRGLFKNRKTKVKALLLNQKLIAGLGNIYVDETLFAAGIRPDREANSLNEAEIKRIYGKIKPILMRAIKARGTTFNNYVDSQGKKGDFVRRLKVYGRTGQKCFVCGNMIKKTKVAGRGTHYCFGCQK